MPDTHCGKQSKLSKTLGSPLYTMGKIISSQCPRKANAVYLLSNSGILVPGKMDNVLLLTVLIK